MSRAFRKTLVVDGRAFEAELRLKDGRLSGALVEGGQDLAVDASVRRVAGRTLALEHEGRVVRATVLREGDVVWVSIEGRTWEVALEDPGSGAAHHAGEEDFAVSPMTGTLVKVAVGPGAQAQEGAELFVVEAMKMEYVVRAPRAVVVAAVRHAAGEQVDQGDVVVTFEATS